MNAYGTVPSLSTLTPQQTDFMACGYDRIGEPLNLHEKGQRWFCEIYAAHVEKCARRGVVLGATRWLTELFHRSVKHTIVVDSSALMLEHLCANISDAHNDATSFRSIQCVHSDWISFARSIHDVDMVAGDNSLSFLEFPNAWADLCESLTAQMGCGARFFVRVLSAPPWHRQRTIKEIVADFVSRPSINYTEVRAALLFRSWNASTFSIRTEDAATEFDSSLSEFKTLFNRHPLSLDNDLTTISKYKGSGAIYYAPPLAEIMRLLARYFRIVAVHYGPYGMSHYFPLIVAASR